jgi:hypothetical protein
VRRDLHAAAFVRFTGHIGDDGRAVGELNLETELEIRAGIGVSVRVAGKTGMRSKAILMLFPFCAAFMRQCCARSKV